ncbi:MAG: hypothetical protein EXR95_11010 [Gemmatimonadetes bacterium]|nr:hypothetical protein [Gemmatimonadota bacterium]
MMVGREPRPSARGPQATRPESEAGDPPPRPCDLCGGAVLERHCKVVCLNCGYLRDCSDP